MTFRDYLRVLRKRIFTVAVVVIVCVLAAVALTLSTKKVYEASAQLFVSTNGIDSVTQAVQANSFASARVQSYTSVIASPKVLDGVIGSLGLKMTRAELASQVSADAPANKVLIDVHATSRSAVQAAQIANALAVQFSRYVESIDAASAPGAATNSAAVTLTVTLPADVPASPISPRSRLNVGLGLVLGLMLGVVVALLRELLDNTVKTPDELSASTNVAVLGAIPLDRSTGDQILAVRKDPHGLRAEAYRQLRTNLQFVDVDRPPRVIAVTSAVPGEGKTSTAINLAASLAEAGQRVCLVEADLRKPTIAKVLGLVGDAGLTSVLIGKARLSDVIQGAGDNFAVLTSGVVPPNPTELLSSEHCRTLIAEVGDQCDVVVIDTAPLLPVADGAAIAALSDATVLVVRASKTTHDEVRRGVESLQRVGVTPVGAVLSQAALKRREESYYYSYRPSAPDVAARGLARAHRANDAPRRTANTRIDSGANSSPESNVEATTAPR